MLVKTKSCTWRILSQNKFLELWQMAMWKSVSLCPKLSRKFIFTVGKLCFSFSGELFFLSQSLSWTSEIGQRDKTQLSKKFKRPIGVKHYLNTWRFSFSFQFRCWQWIVPREDTSGWLQHPNSPGWISGELYYALLFHNWNFLRKKGLVLQNSQRRESFLYKSGSDYDVASPRWEKKYYEKNYTRKNIKVNVQSLLSVLRVWTHRGKFKNILAWEICRNMDNSGSHCYSICPNSGQFKDS